MPPIFKRRIEGSRLRRGAGRFALLLLWLAQAAPAEVYRWQDEAGSIHYADRPAAGARQLPVNPGYSFQRVAKVIDGDTLLLANGEKVRLLGINTPEVESRYRPGEAGGEEAKRWLRNAVEGRRVRLQADVTRRDKYRRLLTHVFDETGGHLNLELVGQGLAAADIHPPNLKYADLLVKAQESAERAGKGLWGDPVYAALPVERLSAVKPKGWTRIVGTPREVRQSRDFHLLVFDDRFSVRIPKENLPLFPALNGYLGQRLEVRGWPTRRNGRYSVLARHPSALVAANPLK